MPAATLLARLIGPLFLAIGAGVLLNRAHYQASVAEGVHSPVLLYLTGVASLLAGLAILHAHCAWTADWRVIVTILGWLCAIGGVIRLVLPRLTMSVAPAIYSGPATMTIVGIIVLIVGGYLSFEGYRR